VVLDTFPKVMQTAFPGVAYTLDKTDWYAQFPNGSQVWFGGLDDKERTEKILGQEYATLYLNECSQIPQGSRDMAVTRLAQRVTQHIEGRESRDLKPRMYYDCNPPSKAHWSYRMFVEKRDPDTKQGLAKPDDYACFQINPEDNAENLPSGYLDTLKGLSVRMQKRFLKGEFADATPNQLFTEEDIDRWRVLDGRVPDMVRIVVAVDPSGSDDVNNADNDAIGIAVVGLGTDGNAYLLEDCTVKAGPATWGRVATSAWERHEADVVVGETNYGGAMVNQTIQVARPRTPFKAVSASRGKVVRAEPFSALYEQGKVRHVGNFAELEDELVAFSTFGYLGQGSPNRADALIWALAELFPGILKGKKADKKPAKPVDDYHGEGAWMA
jgi:predicted phage terminase large subunit-like protein